VLDAKEEEDLEKMDSQTLDSRTDEIANFIHEEFRLLLTAQKLGADGKQINTSNIWDQCDEPVMYGTYKFFTDRLFMECGLAQAGVDKFVLQFGDQQHPHFIDNRNALLRRGHTVVSRLSPADREFFRDKLNLRIESGLQIHKPGDAPILLPARYRLTAIDTATHDGRLQGIITSAGGIATLHRLAESLCWKQTQKLPADVHIAARVGADGREGFLPEFLAKANERLLTAEFINPKDTDLVRQRQSSDAVVDALGL
jgi:hypothetical protein